jgi:hypothetical protein
MRKSLRGGAKIGKSASFRFFDPGIIVAISVENDPSVLLYRASDEVVKLGFKVFGGLESVGKRFKNLCYGSVDHRINVRNRCG